MLLALRVPDAELIHRYLIVTLMAGYHPSRQSSACAGSNTMNPDFDHVAVAAAVRALCTDTQGVWHPGTCAG